jgi:hypothetical protein
MPPLFDLMRAWHDLFMLFGTASATLIGLLFVATSVGSSFFSQSRHLGLRSFLSPSVVLFACVLVASLIVLCPLHNWGALGLLIGSDGLLGLVYALIVLRRMIRHGMTATIDWEDRIFYAALPAVGYAIVIGAGATLSLRMELGCDILAIAMGVLLLIGVRNAWDMTVWAVIKQPN